MFYDNVVKCSQITSLLLICKDVWTEVFLCLNLNQGPTGVLGNFHPARCLRSFCGDLWQLGEVCCYKCPGQLDTDE